MACWDRQNVLSLSKSQNNHRKLVVHIKQLNSEFHTEFFVSGSRWEVYSSVSILCAQSESERNHSVSCACCQANHYSYLNLSGFAGGTCPVLGGIPSSHASGVIFLLTKDTAVQHSSPHPFSLARISLPGNKMPHIPISLVVVLE